MIKRVTHSETKKKKKKNKKKKKKKHFSGSTDVEICALFTVGFSELIGCLANTETVHLIHIGGLA